MQFSKCKIITRKDIGKMNSHVFSVWEVYWLEGICPTDELLDFCKHNKIFNLYIKLEHWDNSGLTKNIYIENFKKQPYFIKGQSAC